MAFKDLNQPLPEQQFGAKAAHLSQLSRNHVSIPGGIALSKNLFENADKKKSVSEAIDHFRSVYGVENKVIVRSSAIGEDGTQHSFAGILESIVVDNTSDCIGAAIDRCCQSYRQPRCLAYQKSTEHALLGMAVLIQVYVEPERAGVLFIEPDQRAIVEYVHGFAGNVVNGTVTPLQVALDLKKKNTYSADEAQWLPQLLAIAKDVCDIFNQPQDIEWLWTSRSGIQIVQARTITTAFPMIQTRPISSNGAAVQMPQTVKKAAKACPTLTWTNVNLIENYPRPITPLLASITRKSYRYYFRNLGKTFGLSEQALVQLDPYLNCAVDVQEGYLYYNLTAIAQAISILPFGYRLDSIFHDFIGTPEGIKPTDSKSSLHVTSSFWVLARMAYTFLTLSQRVRRIEKSVENFWQRNQVNRQRLNNNNASLSNESEAMALVHAFCNLRFHKWRDAAPADVAAALSNALLKEVHKRFFPDDHDLLTAFMSGMENVSNRPPLALWQLADQIKKNPNWDAVFIQGDSKSIWNRIVNENAHKELMLAMMDYISTWGYRCSGELMLTTQTFRDQPETFVTLLKKYLQKMPPSPQVMLNHQVQQRRDAIKEALQRIDKENGALKAQGKKWLLRATLAWHHHAIAMRERVRLQQARMMACLRESLLIVGQSWVDAQLIKRPDEIFLTNLDELCRGWQGSPETMTTLADNVRRRALSDSCVEPASVFRATQYAREANPPSATPVQTMLGDKILGGTTACHGKIAGQAAVLTDLSEIDRFESGQILVTRQTDPGWAPIFPLLKGLVVERGGLLSHGAIIAREFGIPTLIGVTQATRRITHGQTIAINGDDAHVTLYDTPSP